MKTLSLLLGILLVPGLVVGQGRGRARGSEDPRASKSTWTTPSREGLASLEARLERAVSKVSMPHAGILLGRSGSSRGYRLPGYGIVFVLTPRALPGDENLFVVRRPRSHPGGAVHIERHVTRLPPGWEPERVEELERQVLVLQHKAEAHRRAAEEDRERLVHDIRVRVEVEDPEDEPLAVDVTADPGTGGAPPEAVIVGEAPEEPATPPWRFWFEAETSAEERTPEKVVGDVRSALLDVLDAEGEPVPGLAPEEFVTVAIDFVPGGFFASHERPSRTLILRVRQRDLDARAAGTLGSEELRSRVEVIEY